MSNKMKRKKKKPINLSLLAPKLRFKEFANAGEWSLVPLDDLCDRILEKVGDAKLTPVSITAGLGFVAQADKFGRDISGDQYKNYTYLRYGDFAYNKGNSKRYPQGYVCQLKEFDQAAASSAFICFRLKEEYEASFLQGQFDQNSHGRQLLKHITSGARSDGLLNIKPEEFFNILIPVPSIHKEQEKIADCLSSLDELIVSESQKLDVLKKHKKGMLQQLFPLEGKDHPRLRFPEFKSAGKWKQTELRHLGVLVSGLTYSPDDVQNDGLLVLRSSNIQNGIITLDDNVYVKTDVKGVNLSKANDILICVRNGSKSLIGKNALVPQDMPLCTHGAFMTIFRSKSAEFVYQMFQTETYRNQVTADLGATINSINGNQLKKYKFRIPEPGEQKKIASFLSSLDKLIFAQAQKIDNIKMYKKGLMQQIFPSPEENMV